MTEKYLSAFWQLIAPGLADHLWQSTLVALVAALLTLALRNHHARARYWLWLAASLKFLVPFSLLVGIGSHFGWPRASATAASTNLYFVIEEVSQPFTQATTQIARQPASVLSSIPWIPVLATVWLCGFFAVLFLWIARWRRISSAMRASVRLHEGREVNALRRLEQIGGLRTPIAFLLSHTSLEPGIFGIARPTLIWPEGISKHLEDAHLEAVLAHEVWHVRRRDNLFAALHMLVEAVFWFHPLVWWLGARLVEERERACDEEVVALGSDRQVYAESILKVCEFCLSSPLVCVSGVTGADLKTRMVHIMSDRILHKLNFTRKFLLTTAAFLAIAVPITFGVFRATPSRAQSQGASASKFINVSIKPHVKEANDSVMTKMFMSPIDGGFTASNVSPHSLMQLAYRLQDTQLVAEPDWFKTAKYDIKAAVDQPTLDEIHNANQDQRNVLNQHLLRELLADYFGVSVHQESRELPVYELTLAGSGTKLEKTNQIGMTQVRTGEIIAKGAPLSILTSILSDRLGRTIVDKTGLQGDYAFTLQWTPDADEQARIQSSGLPPEFLKAEKASNSTAPPLLTAIQEQLGLKLEPNNERVPVLVIDRAQNPAEN